MSKLYIKQQVFSGIDKFTVKNENEEDCYIIEGIICRWEAEAAAYSDN